EILYQPGGGFLMRDSQIHADQSQRRYGAERGRKIRSGDAKRRIGSVHAKRRVGGVVHRRRFRLCYRIAKNRRDRNVTVGSRGSHRSELKNEKLDYAAELEEGPPCSARTSSAVNTQLCFRPAAARGSTEPSPPSTSANPVLTPPPASRITATACKLDPPVV